MKFRASITCGIAASALAAALVNTPALAQDAAPAAEAEDKDEIVVTGIRASLERAADIKREADQVLDVITAEDVGKLPDANVAEALQRVTGVQITRVFGEGQSVSVRGLQQVRVEVDGRTLLGWSARLSPPVVACAFGQGGEGFLRLGQVPGVDLEGQLVAVVRLQPRPLEAAAFALAHLEVVADQADRLAQLVEPRQGPAPAGPQGPDEASEAVHGDHAVVRHPTEAREPGQGRERHRQRQKRGHECHC